MNITPDDPDHARLEADVTRDLEGLGYKVEAAPYHDSLPREVVRILQHNYSPTSAYLRSRADRMAVHESGPCFEWDAKTHSEGSRPNMAVEALPLLMARRKADMGVRTMFCYRDPHNGYAGAFWTADMPPVGTMFIPERSRWGEIDSFLRRGARTYWPDADIVELPNCGGSNDPFCVIGERHLSGLPGWTELASQQLQPTAA